MSVVAGELILNSPFVDNRGWIDGLDSGSFSNVFFF